VTASERLVGAAQEAGGVTLGYALWYAAGAGLLWLGFYVLFRRAALHRKVVRRVPPRWQLGQEAAASLRSLLVFGLVALGIRLAARSGYTRIYWQVGEYGWGWFVASIAVAVLVHDAYFYWTHRLLHQRWLFRLLHRTHHRSTNPTPWAAYSFGVGEALVQAGIAPLLLFTVPMHPAAFMLFMIWQIGFNVFGHCGYEIYPRWFLETWAGKLLNTPTHHALHHEKFRCNYGIYFNVWDRLLGTNHPDYPARFARCTAAPPPAGEGPGRDPLPRAGGRSTPTGPPAAAGASRSSPGGRALAGAAGVEGR
jgi:sterol desaturase/sphingolipid hydroxylase (fatty acid hydroxylase superfamily)